MNKHLRILILEDVPEDAELMERELHKGGELTFSSKRVETKEDFIKELEEFSPDLILADYKLPSFDAMSALAIVKKQCPDIPFIIISGTLGEEMAVETLKSGATDYVLKDHLSKIVPAVYRALREARERTKRKQAEEELKRYTEKLEKANYLKDLFNDIMHHDLLSPAGIIKGITELQIREPMDSKLKETLLMIHRNSKRLIEMIENASAYEKLESMEKLELEKLDLNEILTTVANEFKPLMEDRNITVEYLAKEKCYAMVSPVIESGFSNLISNAIKYSPEGKKIEVGIEYHDACIIYVKDWGCGIKDEDKGKLFTRFQRSEKHGVKGSGLGLAIVKRVVELHKGKVWVEDNPEGGSVFYVSLPKEEAEK